MGGHVNGVVVVIVDDAETNTIHMLHSHKRREKRLTRVVAEKQMPMRQSSLLRLRHKKRKKNEIKKNMRIEFSGRLRRCVVYDDDEY